MQLALYTTRTSMLDHYPLPLQGRPERRHLYVWVKEEEEYVATKFDDQRAAHDEKMATRDLEEFWSGQIIQYIGRAHAFFRQSIDVERHIEQRRLEMLGQQALAKGFMTFKGCVESSIRVYGSMPKPGFPSGEILHWYEPVYREAMREQRGD